MSKPIYHTITFNYQGKEIFSDCLIHRRLSSDDLLRILKRISFDDRLLDAPLVNVEICVDFDPVIKMDVYDPLGYH